MSIIEKCRDRDYCISEIREARRIFSSKKEFTKGVAEGLCEGLAFLYIYCPEDLQCAVLSYLQEAEQRSAYIVEG